MIILDQPEAVQVDTDFSLTAAIADTNGVISDDTTSLTVALQSNPSGAQLLSAELSQAADDGVVSWTDLQVDTAGTYVLKVSGTGVTGWTVAFEATAAAIDVPNAIVMSDKQAGETGATAVPYVADADGTGYYPLTSTTAHTLYLNTNSGVDIPNAQGSFTCEEVGDEGYLTITNPAGFTSAEVEDEAVTVGTVVVTPTLIEVDHAVGVKCEGDGEVFVGNKTFYFKLDLVENTDDALNVKVDEPMLQTLINASAADIVTADDEIVRATCAVYTDLDVTTGAGDVINVDGGADRNDFQLSFTADGEVTTPPDGQFGSDAASVSFNTDGTYYLKCLYSASTDDDINPTQYFKKKVVVTGDVDIVYLKDAEGTVEFKNQEDLEGSEATDVNLDVPYELNLFSSVEFDPASATSTVQITCTLYEEGYGAALFDTPSSTMTVVSTSGGRTGGNTAPVAETTGRNSFTLDELTGTQTVAADGQIGDVAMTVKFTSVGVYHLKCLHTNTDDASVLAVTTATQWFQHKISVRGDIDKLQLRDTTRSVTINNQTSQDLTGDGTQIMLDETYTFGLYSSSTFTSSDPAVEIKVTCTPYRTLTASGELEDAVTGLFTRDSFDADTGTASNTLVLGEAPDAGVEVTGQIGNGTISLHFGTVGTYYLKCQHTSLDANITGTSLSQWFQHKIVVVGAVNELYLKDVTSGSSIELRNQDTLSAATATELVKGKTYPLGLFTSTPYTSSGGDAQVQCTSYSSSSLGSSSAVTVMDVNGTDSDIDTAFKSTSTLTIGVNSVSSDTPVSGQIGDGEAHMQFTQTGTFYIKCLHTGTTDEGLVGTTPGEGPTTETQWFQFAVTVHGDVDVLYLMDATKSVTIDNQSDLSATPTQLVLNSEYTFELHTKVRYDPQPGLAEVSCSVHTDALFASTAAPFVDVTGKSAGASTDTTGVDNGRSSFVLGSTPADTTSIEDDGQIGTGTITLRFGVPGHFYLKCIVDEDTADTGLIGDPSSEGLTAEGQWFQHHIHVVGTASLLELKDEANSVSIGNDDSYGSPTTLMLDKEYTLGLYAATGYTSQGGEVGLSCVLFSSEDMNKTASEIDIESTDNAAGASIADTDVDRFWLAEMVAAGTVSAGRIGDAEVKLKITAVDTYYLKCTHGPVTDAGLFDETTTQAQWLQHKIIVQGYTDVVFLWDSTENVMLSNMDDLSGDGTALIVDKRYTFTLQARTTLTADDNSGAVSVKCSVFTNEVMDSASGNVITVTGSDGDTNGDTTSTGDINEFILEDTDVGTTGITQGNAIGGSSITLFFNAVDTYYIKCMHDDGSTTDHTGFLSETETTQWFQFKVTVVGDNDVLQLKDTSNGVTIDNRSDLQSAAATNLQQGKEYTFGIYMDSVAWKPAAADGLAGVTCTVYEGTEFDGDTPDVIVVTDTDSADEVTTASSTTARDNFEIADSTGGTDEVAADGGRIGDGTITLYFNAPGTYSLKCAYDATTEHDANFRSTDASKVTSEEQWLQHKIEVLDQHVLALSDSANEVTLSHVDDLANATPLDLVIDKRYTFQLLYMGSEAITPTGEEVRVTCTTYSHPGVSDSRYVDDVLDVDGTNTNSSSFSLEVTTGTSEVLAEESLSTTTVAVAFDTPGTYYLVCEVEDPTGVGATKDAEVYRYAAASSTWHAKVRVTGQNRVLDLREAPFTAVAGSGGSNDLRPFAQSTGDLLSAGSLLSSPLDDSTAVLLLVDKTYSPGYLVQLSVTQAPTADVTVDCYSSVPELLEDIYDITLPSGETGLVNVDIPNVAGEDYIEPTTVEYRCSPVYTVGNFLSSSVIPFRVHVVPKIRIMMGAFDGPTNAPSSVSGRTLSVDTDITTMTSTPEDCRTIDLFEGANLGTSTGTQVIKIETAIRPGTDTIAITCVDTASTAVYSVTSSGAANVSSTTAITDAVLAQTAEGSAKTAALIAPNGDSVVTAFRCYVSDIDVDDETDETPNNNFTLNESVYFSMRVNPVTLVFGSTPPSSIIEGESPQVVVRRSDGGAGSFTCSTTTADVLADDVGNATFGALLTLTAHANVDVDRNTDVNITCRPIATSGVVYDSATADDSVSFTLTIRPQALVIEAKGGQGLLSLADRTAIAVTAGVNVDITGGETEETIGFVTEEQYNDGQGLLQISLNDNDTIGAATILCTPDNDAFQAVYVESFVGSAKDLTVETSTLDDTTYADVTQAVTVEFTCKAVTSITDNTEVAIGKMAAGETSTYKLHVVPIVPELVLGTAGIAETDEEGITKTSGDVLATGDIIQLVEGQSLSDILQIRLTSDPSSTPNTVQWNCEATRDGILSDTESTTNNIDPITPLSSTAKPIVLSTTVFRTFEVGASGETVSLICTYEYIGEVTVESPAPENVGGVDINTSIRATFFIAPKFPVAEFAGDARTFNSTDEYTVGETGAVRGRSEEEAFVSEQLADPEEDRTEAELREDFKVDSWDEVPVIYVGEGENTTSIRLAPPQVNGTSINLGATQNMTCLSSDSEILDDITVTDVSSTNATAVPIPSVTAAALDAPVLITYTCTYDDDVVDGEEQVHITGGETTTESVQFTVLVSPVILEVQNSSDAVGLDNEEQTYTDDISGTTETPILVGGSTAAQVGDVFEVSLNIDPDAGTVEVVCISDTPGVLADTDPVTISGTTGVVVPVPAPSVVAEDTLVTYTCVSTEESDLPALEVTYEILVVTRKIFAIGSVSSANEEAYSSGAPGLVADELDYEIMDPDYSPVAGVVDLRPVLVEGQVTEAGDIVVVHFPVPTTAPVTMKCTPDVTAIAEFTATQTAAGTSLPVTIPPSAAITERLDVNITCAVQGAEAEPTAPVGGYAVGRSTSFTINLQPLRIVILDSSNNPVTTNAIVVSEGAKTTSAFKVGLNGIPGASTRVECRAPDASVFASGTAAFSVTQTFTTDVTAVAFDLPASKNVSNNVTVRFACALFDPSTVPTQSSTATASSTTTASTEPSTTEAPTETTPAGTTAAPTPAPTLNPSVLEPKQTVFFNVTVQAGTIVAMAGNNARNSRNIAIGANTVLSSTVFPVISIRKNDYTDVVRIEAPWKGTDWMLKCTSQTTSVMRTPEVSEYEITSTRTVSINLAPAMDIGDVNIKCEPRDAVEAGKAFLSTASAATFKLSVVGPAIQILTGSTTGASSSLVRASDLMTFAAGVDITGSGSLTTTVVLPIGYNASLGAHMRLKAPVSNTSVSVACESSNTDVLADIPSPSLSTSLTGHGNRNASMVANIDLPAPAAVTSDTTVVYTCSVKCDLTSDTLGEAKFDVWVPAPQIFVRASYNTRAEGTRLTLPVSQAVTSLKLVSSVYMGMGYDYFSSVVVYTSTPTGAVVPITCTANRDWLTIVATDRLNSSAFYSGSAATIALYSSAIAEDTATVTCTLDESQGDYEQGSTFSFSVKAEPVATMLVVAGTRSALFDPEEPVAITNTIQMENIGQPLRGAVALLSSGYRTTVACMSDRADVLDHIMMNSGTSFDLNDSTLFNFEHMLYENDTYTALAFSDFPVTASELRSVFNTNDLEIPAPSGVGTVTYTCADYVYSSDEGFLLDASPEVGSATFTVEVTGPLEGTRPPATRTKATVSLKMKVTFDVPPPREVKEAIFALVQETVADELGVSAEDVFVYEDAARRKLMAVSAKAGSCGMTSMYMVLQI